MMMRRRFKAKEADLDITSFMNLMIVLVPVLLMSMVFSQITVLDLKLPDIAASDNSKKNKPSDQLELVIRKRHIDINYPAGIRLKRINKVKNAEKQLTYNFTLLSDVLQEVKRKLQQKNLKKRDILILSEPDTDYQTLVTVMDTVRSFKAVVAASVVNAELFPDVSLGDAPQTQTRNKRR